MGMSMIQWVGVDGASHNLTPSASFEEACLMVAPRQYIAARVLDMFKDLRVDGVWTAAPGGAPINPEACALIRAQNQERHGEVFNLAQALDGSLWGPARMVGIVPELFGSDSMSVDYLVIKKGQEQCPNAQLSPKAQRLVALAESIEGKTFALIEVDASFLSRMAQRQEEACDSWMTSQELSERFKKRVGAQGSSISSDQRSIEKLTGEIEQIEVNISNRMIAGAKNLEQTQEERRKHRDRLLSQLPFGARARVHLHKLFGASFEPPTGYDEICADLLASLSSTDSFDHLTLKSKEQRVQELRGRLDMERLRQTEVQAAVEECMAQQQRVKESMPAGLSDGVRFYHERSVEDASKRLNMFVYHAMPDFHPEENSPLAGKQSVAQKLHALVAFAPAISCSSFCLGGGSFKGGSFGDPQSGAATCALIGSGVIESAYSCDHGTAPSADNPSTRAKSSQRAAEVNQVISQRTNQSFYNEVVVAQACPVALFKNLDAMIERGGPLSGKDLLAHMDILLAQASAPLPGAQPEDAHGQFPALVLADGKMHRIEFSGISPGAKAEIMAMPKAKSAAEALSMLSRAHRLSEIKDQKGLSKLAKQAPWVSDDQRLRAAGALIKIYKEPYARALMRKAREKVGLDRATAAIGSTGEAKQKLG
jgi:hypothetical protein